MTDYIRTRFPLDRTSTQHMSGKAVYNLVRWNKPGIIASVELFFDDAETFREAVWEAMADAWNEGHAMTCVYYPDCADNGHHPNPYQVGGTP